MTYKDFDGRVLANMFLSALTIFNKKYAYIDSLNIFPVPDGDTGTNMYLTFFSGAQEIEELHSATAGEVAETLARGSLMGARGNSGVILSQLFKGFSLAIQGREVVDAKGLVLALEKASDVAYKSVSEPVEGTILTVARAAAHGARKAYESNLDIVSILKETTKEARIALDNTPEQMAVLKEVGVVDAGGEGYVTILEGMLAWLLNDEGDLDIQGLVMDSDDFHHEELHDITFNAEEIKYIYDTQILIDLPESVSNDLIEKMRNDLQKFGDSLIVVGSKNTVKIHIHSNEPDLIMGYCLKLGDLRDIVIENMKLQSQTRNTVVSPQEKQKPVITTQKGCIAVAQGDGFETILKDVGIDFIINGGRLMNPSVDDFVKAINDLPNKEIIIFPNNKNIISTAEKAAKITEKDVIVIPTRFITETITAMLVFNDEEELRSLEKEMMNEIGFVKTCKITRAAKDLNANGLNIKKEDYLGLLGNDIKINQKSLLETIECLFDKVFEGEDLVACYYGKTVSEKELEAVRALLKEKYKIDGAQFFYGGQELYPFIISLE
ncbi:MAG: DAK2 domain-containing protein [bacterium]